MRAFRFLLILVCVLLVGSLLAKERVHTVKKGDTLWDLSGYYYHDPFLWPHIWQANRNEIADPHWIYPWQEFVIPPVSEKPGPPIPPVVTPPPEVTPPVEEPEIPGIEAVERMIPAVAKELAFRAGYITREKIDGGYILESEPPDIERLLSNNTVYINQGEFHGVKIGDGFAIYRMGKGVSHPRTGQYLGKIVRILGSVRVTEVKEELSTAIIDRSFEPIKVKDRIMPYEEVDIPLGITPSPAETPLEGYMVAELNGDGIMKPFDVVFIDMGRLAGVGPGDVFEIYRAGKRTGDPQTGRSVELPELKAGALQVLSSKDETSAAYITSIDGKLDLKPGETIRLTHTIPGVGEREVGEIEGE